MPKINLSDTHIAQSDWSILSFLASIQLSLQHTEWHGSVMIKVIDLQLKGVEQYNCKTASAWDYWMDG